MLAIAARGIRPWLCSNLASANSSSVGNTTFVRSFFPFPSPVSSQSSPPEPETFSVERTFNYSPKELYQIVADVGSYPLFLPFCTHAKLSNQANQDHLVGGKQGDIVQYKAELGVGFMSVSETYTSLVTCTKWSQVTAQASDTPLFHQLDTTWSLTPIKTGPQPSTKVALYLQYSFVNPLHQSLASIAFNKVSQDILAAFDKRTRQVLSK